MRNLPDKAIIRTLSLGDKSVAVKVDIVNSTRGSKISARVTGKDTLTLTKPKRVSLTEALNFLDKISDWVIEQLANTPETYTLRQWFEKNPHIFVGENKWNVFLSPSRVDAFFVEIENRQEVVFLSPTPDESTKDTLPDTFRDFASKKISKIVKETAERVGIKYTSVSVRDQSSIWGSSASGGKLSFNWRILLLAPEFQNYIICHELAHIRFMDHSVSFWIWLNTLCPRAKHIDKMLSKTSNHLFNVTLK